MAITQRLLVSHVTSVGIRLMIGFIFLSTCLFDLGELCFYKKYWGRMISDHIVKSISVRGVLDCEILCLEMADSCLAANVLYRDGHYVCDVIAGFPDAEHEFEHAMTTNPRGKLIIKQVGAVPRACVSRPCQNGGDCREIAFGYKCVCPSEYLGLNCQLSSLRNLARVPGTRCEASSVCNDQCACEKAINGDMADFWATGGPNPGNWIKITFPLLVEVHKVQLWQRCTANDMFSRINFNFGGRSITRSLQRCHVSCADPSPSIEFTMTPGQVTSWVKLTAFTRCPSTSGYFGVREINCIGKFIGN